MALKATAGAAVNPLRARDNGINARAALRVYLTAFPLQVTRACYRARWEREREREREGPRFRHPRAIASAASRNSSFPLSFAIARSHALTQRETRTRALSPSLSLSLSSSRTSIRIAAQQGCTPERAASRCVPLIFEIGDRASSKREKGERESERGGEWGRERELSVPPRDRASRSRDLTIGDKVAPPR